LDVNNILVFITDLKSTPSQFHEIGIELAPNIVTYLIVDKIPSNMENLAKRITQSDKTITPEQVMELLKIYDNNRSMKLNGSGSRANLISLLTVFTDTEDTQCKKGAHNTAAPNHNQANCWKLYPEKRPLQFQNQGTTQGLGIKKEKSESTVSTFFSSISLNSSQFILDMESSAHMVLIANSSTPYNSKN
jgi:hypothetical protein